MGKMAKRERSLQKRGIYKLVIVALVLIGCMWGAIASLQRIKLGLDLAGGVSITYQTQEKTPSEEVMQDIIYKLLKRVESYSTEAEVYREGKDRINVDIPGVRDAKQILEELGAPGTLQFVDEAGNLLLTGDMISDARAGYRKNTATQTGEHVVELTLDQEGTALFAEATKANLGKKIFIVYDDEIVSSPIVHTAVTGGQCYIENLASMEAADRLATTIRVGALPLKLEEIRSTVVGAKLGEEAIGSSLNAGCVGLILVILLMCLMYRIPGVAASAALLLYVALMILALRGFDLTLTLPGVAGIVLGIGMAVDANVIIFARLREELGSGTSVKSAIREGFLKARSAIWDGNITTLIAAVILLWMGAGMIKGFAQTLALGIVISMFTALIVTRIVLTALYEAGFQQERFFGHSKRRCELCFVGKMRYFVISGIFLSVGVAGMLFHGLGAERQALNYGLEFQGGTATTILFEEELSLEQISGTILPTIRERIGGGQIEAQKVAGTNEVILKTRTLSPREQERLRETLKESFGVKPDAVRSDSISATISDEMRQDAVVSVILSIVSMMLYIGFRFRDVRVGISAMLTLIHDVLAVFVVYAWLRLVVGNTFVACLLAIVGYSINATIVVFDRIREHLREKHGKEDLQSLVDRSIAETLERSLHTSLTTLIMAVSLSVFGVRGIREFALPLMVGIICGTYSSICLAGTIWYWLRTKYKKKSEA